MDYEQKYKSLVGKIKRAYMNALTDTTKAVLEDILPELVDSEDKRIKKALIKFHKSTIDIDGIKGEQIVAWLEKQGESFTKKDIDDAYLKGVCDTKSELEKQGEKKSLNWNELTWEDINDLETIMNEVHSDFRNGIGEKTFGLEVLERFLYNKDYEHCEQKSAWSEEDKNFMYDTLSNLTELKDRYGEGYGNVGKCINWLKSLKKRIGG